MVFVDETEKYLRYQCPFCGPIDKQYPTVRHYGIVSKNDLLCKPIHCHFTGQFLWVDYSINGILLREEKRFMNHLRQFDNLEGPLTPQQAFKMRTGGGCPEDLIRELVTDLPEYDRLMEESKKRDRDSRVKQIYET